MYDVRPRHLIRIPLTVRRSTHYTLEIVMINIVECEARKTSVDPYPGVFSKFFRFERSSIKSPGLYDEQKKPLKTERTWISFKPKKE